MPKQTKPLFFGSFRAWFSKYNLFGCCVPFGHLKYFKHMFWIASIPGLLYQYLNFQIIPLFRWALSSLNFCHKVFLRTNGIWTYHCHILHSTVAVFGLKTADGWPMTRYQGSSSTVLTFLYVLVLRYTNEARSWWDNRCMSGLWKMDLNYLIMQSCLCHKLQLQYMLF